MKIVWDESKRLANLEKHGLDFADVVFLDWHNAIVESGHSSGRRRRHLCDAWLGGDFDHQLPPGKPEGEEQIA